MEGGNNPEGLGDAGAERLSLESFVSDIGGVTSGDPTIINRGFSNLIKKFGSLMKWSENQRQYLLALIQSRAVERKSGKTGSEITPVPAEVEPIIAAIEGVAAKDPLISAEGLSSLMSQMRDRLQWDSHKFKEVTLQAAKSIVKNRKFNWTSLLSHAQRAAGTRREVAWTTTGVKNFWDELQRQVPGLQVKTLKLQPILIHK